MADLVLSRMAEADLDRIVLDIASNNGVGVATRMMAELRRSLDLLAQYPLIGRPRPRIGQNLRSWPLVAPYMRLYLPITNGIEVVRILHGHRRLTRKMVSGV